MIITKSEPFTLEEIAQLSVQFEVYIKTVIDLENKVCSAGMDRHFEGEQILLRQGSKQSNISLKKYYDRHTTIGGFTF